jgi:hypothetical protein
LSSPGVCQMTRAVSSSQERLIDFVVSGGSSSVGRAAAFQAQCQVMPGGPRVELRSARWEAARRAAPETFDLLAWGTP